MAAKIFELVGEKNGKKKAIELLESGKAYKKMCEIIKAQKGKIIDPDDISLGKFSFTCTARRNGTIKSVRNKIISKIARIAGAPKDKEAGLYLYKHIGERVKKGEWLFSIYSDTKDKLEYAAHVLDTEDAMIIG
jgi:AMP phosphorylase